MPVDATTGAPILLSAEECLSFKGFMVTLVLTLVTMVGGVCARFVNDLVRNKRELRQYAETIELTRQRTNAQVAALSPSSSRSSGSGKEKLGPRRSHNSDSDPGNSAEPTHGS
jgi:hypothetical protein